MELLGKCICIGACLCGSAMLALTLYAVNDWTNYINEFKYKEVGALDEP
jgi:hypothetical protein